MPYLSARKLALSQLLSSRLLKNYGVILVLVLGLMGCALPSNQTSSNSNQGQQTQSDRQGKKVILTTFTVLADMAQNVAGDRAVVESITKFGAEIHGYEPTPSDLKRGQGASLILDNGLNLERWAERFYNNFPKVNRFTLSEGITPINISDDAYVGKPNPHAWMSPQNALIYVDNIRKALTQVDPDNAAVYAANAQTYKQQILAIDAKLRNAIAAIPPERRFIVSCEGAFSYLAKDYGLKEIYLWPVNSEKQATPKQVQKVIELVRKHNIPTVFCESTISNEPQLQVAQETGAKFGGVFYVDSLSPPDGVTPTYLKLLEYNVSTLIRGLERSQ
ncbi:MAG: metal ABC transporter substrate-binding protein [Pseudanabaenaceae cyanobacterium bins.39]|nr:metal ABC transporter substrate-binding protein [Pseudanabaenaceae cyanobacterium bins.39]